jgi:hypothetical protein
MLNAQKVEYLGKLKTKIGKKFLTLSGAKLDQTTLNKKSHASVSLKVLSYKN